jgi:hypothetical protein
LDHNVERDDIAIVKIFFGEGIPWTSTSLTEAQMAAG